MVLKKLKKICYISTLCLCLAGSMLPTQKTNAASYGTATLRILSTSDLHGQSINFNYDTASEYSKGSLAQVNTLLKQQKKNLKYGGILQVDCGDTVYGFGSDKICDGSISGTEYMYDAMASMGYDAMTLGNHDFDYGYEYIQEAIEDSGLENKMIVSNVYDAKTKKNIWAENKIITKTLNTTTGKKVNVKIGLIGVTVPTLTSHSDHTAILSTKDMVDSVEEQVPKLKSKNVDLIVVLAHSGIGKQEPVVNDDNVAYAISKIPGVDAIIGGHAHVNFPSTDTNVQKYYQYPGVSADGLLNGTSYVAVADHATAIGITDIKLQYINGKISVVSKKARVQKVKKSTEGDAAIAEINEDFQDQLDALYDQPLAKVDGNVNNYFGMLEDNLAVQVANEACIRYGIEYVNQNAAKYKDKPVISATSYNLTGLESKDDYININGEFTIGDSLNVQNWEREFAFIYMITGAQIKEWLEWQASAYQLPTAANAQEWSDERAQSYVEEQNLVPVLSNEWFTNWNGFTVFDGIEYEINPSKSPRYNKSGKLINSKAHRITKLTCNGASVKDDTEFVLVSKRMIQSQCVVGTQVAEQIISNDRVYINQLVQDYIKNQTMNGRLDLQADHNWQVSFPQATNYLVRSSSNSIAYAKTKDWYVKLLEKTANHAYYQAALGTDNSDQANPLLVVACGKKQETNQPVPVVVQASDESGVVSVKYQLGMLSKDDDEWKNAKKVYGNQVSIAENGRYSFLATDSKGNKTVKYIDITNYNEEKLEQPIVTKCTNRSKKITGTALPNTTLYIKADGKTYSVKIADDGKFSYAIPVQKADALVQLWVQDSSGKSSDILSYTVNRTGANVPTVDGLTNKEQYITGYINDSNYCKIVALSKDTAYVPKDGGTESYENSSLYDEELKIVPCDFEIDSGSFGLKIPVQRAQTELKVYSMDWIDRPSVVTQFTVKEVAPNMPIVQDVYTIDDCVYGRVPVSGNKIYDIEVDDGINRYQAKTDETGYFHVKVGSLPEGCELKVSASDQVGGETRISAIATVTANPYSGPMAENSEIEFAETDSKQTMVAGAIDDYTGQVNLMIGNTRVITQTDEYGYFSYEMVEPKAAGTTIVAMVRDTDGTIMDIQSTTIALALPDEPLILNKSISDKTKKIKLLAKDKCIGVLKVGSKYYKVSDCVYDDVKEGYIYTFTLKKPADGDSTITAFMMNEAGKSTKVKMKVKKTIIEDESTDQETANAPVSTDQNSEA